MKMTTGLAVGIGVGPFVTKQPEGSSWTPEELFSGGADGVWYDPSDLSTMWQDSAGTTPVTAANQPVGLIHDKSGNGNHASQTTSAARPLVRQTGGGLWYLDFDGIDDVLISAGLGAVMGNASTKQYGLAVEAQDTTGILLCDTNSPTPYALIYDDASTSTTVTSAGTYAAVRKNAATASYGNRDDGHTLFSTLGVVTLQHATPSSTWSPMGVGSVYQTASFSANAHWYACVIREGAVTGDDLASLESYLASKAGVSL